MGRSTKSVAIPRARAAALPCSAAAPDSASGLPGSSASGTRLIAATSDAPDAAAPAPAHVGTSRSAGPPRRVLGCGQVPGPAPHRPRQERLWMALRQGAGR